MNAYYKNADGIFFAIRQNGVKYAPSKGEVRVPSSRALRQSAKYNGIATFLPQGGNKLVRL